MPMSSYLLSLPSSQTINRRPSTRQMLDTVSLSAELYLQIASYLSQVDLLNLSLTSKQIRHHTEPELYKEYKDSRGVTVKKFLSQIIHHPQLAQHVRSLDLGTWSALPDLNPSLRNQCRV